MKDIRMYVEQISEFEKHLREDNCSPGTIENYTRHTLAFTVWAEARPVAPELAAAWRDGLLQKGYQPATVNAMVVAVNRFFSFMGWEHCKIKALRIQRRLFRDTRRELTRCEYGRLLDAAHRQGRERLALLIEAICATGIRVSEAQYLTVEAAKAGKAEVALKGKIRTILIPGKLRKKLLAFARKNKTVSGAVFLTRNGIPLSRKQIWAEMKSLCRAAKVAESKVFPHNLRHLFARVFYKACHDVAKLADVLGHSSIETTRIYLISTGAEHERQLERLRLIS